MHLSCPINVLCHCLPPALRLKWGCSRVRLEEPRPDTAVMGPSAHRLTLWCPCNLWSPAKGTRHPLFCIKTRHWFHRLHGATAKPGEFKHSNKFVSRGRNTGFLWLHNCTLAKALNQFYRSWLELVLHSSWSKIQPYLIFKIVHLYFSCFRLIFLFLYVILAVHVIWKIMAVRWNLRWLEK